MMYAAKKGQVAVTPPYKPALEEKLAFGLFHHPELAPFWEQTLTAETRTNLGRLLPRTWILDPQPVPPTAVIPHLLISGRAVSDFRRLAHTTQKERQLVVKPSGFSELAWGSRGVSIGHDLPQIEWAAALEQALQSFSTIPYVLQEFHKGRLFEATYWDERSDSVVPMSGRVRLSPYYFVAGDKAELGEFLQHSVLRIRRSFTAWSTQSWRLVRSRQTLLPRGGVMAGMPSMIQTMDTHSFPQ